MEIGCGFENTNSVKLMPKVTYLWGNPRKIGIILLQRINSSSFKLDKSSIKSRSLASQSKNQSQDGFRLANL
jgi:hypothetical protein